LCQLKVTFSEINALIKWFMVCLRA